MPEKQVSEILAQYVADFDLTAIPEEVCAEAKKCVLDTLGVSIAGMREPEMLSIRRTFAPWMVGTQRRASLWGTDEKTEMLGAALLNGCASHALELDDNHPASKSHPGGVVISAALPLAEALHASGAELLSAVIVGYDVMGRVGAGADIVGMRKRGFHNTGVIGTFGAAAAAARLLGLTVPQTVSAFGIAGMQSAGLWGFIDDGASCKKLSTGKAAMNGILAALLAKGGMTGPLRVLDAPDGGLYPAMSGGFDLKKVTAGLGRDFCVTQVDKKLYPSCRTSHPAIDAALLLRGQGVRAEEIESVLVESYEVAVFQCGFMRENYNEVDARFSIPYLASAAFVFGEVSLGSYRPEVMEDPALKRLIPRVRVTEDKAFTEAYYKQHWGCRMTVTLRDGTKRSVTVPDASGAFCTPLNETEVRAKFDRMVRGILPDDRSKRLADTVMKLETVGDVSALFEKD